MNPIPAIKKVASNRKTMLMIPSWVTVHLPFLALAVILGGLHAWAAVTSQSMNPDGVSYLDIGDAYFQGDWANAINAVWPPLYSWLLGLVNFVFKPSMQWEFPTVHFLNFVIYLGTLASFIFMWSSIRGSKLIEGQNDSIGIPEWHWWALGYSLFIWTSLNLIQIWSVTPDMLMAAMVYLSAGLIAQIRSSSSSWRLFFFLGLVLGLGYLAKTFMFSIAIMFLGLSLFLKRLSWNSILKTMFAGSIFLLVSLPFIFLISQKTGSFTIGESGTITYLRYVGGIPFPHWQGDPVNNIAPTHPSRVIFDDPPIYEFGDPIGGTYPISADPSYWYEGLKVRFNLQNQIYRLLDAGIYYADLFGQKQGIFFASILALYLFAMNQKSSFPFSVQKWVLTLPAIAAFGLYALVLVADRYIGVFVLLFWTDILANLRLKDNLTNRSVIKIFSSIAIFGLLLNVFLFNIDGIGRLNPTTPPGAIEQISNPPARPLAVAVKLQELGIQPDDRVAVIGYAYDSFWARLARVKIVAEMPEEQAVKFWVGDDQLQEGVLNAFARSGAKFVIAENVPGYVQPNGWQQVGESSCYIYVMTNSH
jgi:hypothetical protein